MRILHLIHQYPPDHAGGTELYAQSLARHQSVAGHQVSVVCPETATKGGPHPVIEEGVRIYRLGGGRRSRATVFLSTFLSGRDVAAFRSILNREQPDIVHLQHLMGVPLAFVDLLVERGIPYVITLHDYWYGCANAQLLTNYDSRVCSGPDARFINCGRCLLARGGLGMLDPAAPLVAPLMARRYHLLQGIFRGADSVLASTVFVREAYAGMGFQADQVDILPLGIEVTDGQIASAQAERDRRPATGPFRIGYVGGISPQKGVHCLIEAVNGLPDGVELLVYGDMSAFPDYLSSLQRLATHGGVEFKGAVSRSSLWPVLGNLDVLVVPTLWYETYSLIVQESYAAGLPVIASRIGVMPEVVSDGVSGLLFPPGDAPALRQVLLDVMNHPDRLASLRAGLPPVTTMTSHTGKILALYGNITDRKLNVRMSPH
jgi:glycosyltransferase involved in cell wall biosynthesis